MNNRFSVEPEDGQVFECTPGAILDGGGREDAAFDGDANNVTIRGCIIQNYASAAQRGAIQADGGSGWLIENNEIRENAAAGINAGDGWIVRNNYIHHNHQIGVKADGARNALFENNEIAFNNYLEEYDGGWEAGGSKFARTTNLIVRGNNVHDNRGPGLWTDIDNQNTLYENNTVKNNNDAGIFHEISGTVIIRNNHVEGNGYPASFGDASANIFISESPGTSGARSQVYGNTVVMSADPVFNDTGHGIILHSGSRGTTRYVDVYDNDVYFISGGTVAGTDRADSTIRFSNNSYHGVNASADAWNWDGSEDFAGWQAAGQDEDGAVAN